MRLTGLTICLLSRAACTNECYAAKIPTSVRPAVQVAGHLEEVWNAETTTNRDKKRLLRCLIEEVQLTTEEKRYVIESSGKAERKRAQAAEEGKYTRDRQARLRDVISPKSSMMLRLLGFSTSRAGAQASAIPTPSPMSSRCAVATRSRSVRKSSSKIPRRDPSPRMKPRSSSRWA